MKAVISTAGRFHLFALARELEKRGCLERIYSGFVWSALAREDVPRAKVTTFPWFRTPYMALGRLHIPTPRPFGQWLETISCIAQDRYVEGNLPDCDVFIGHDGAGLRTGVEAKRRGYVYITDSGTSHVDFQRSVLREEFTSYGLAYSDRNNALFQRQIEEYDTADAIIVPSTFAKQSFINLGCASDKVHLVPYGVRIDQFYPTERPPPDLFRILFVGALSIRKGARYLFDAFRDFRHGRKELVIIGSITNELRDFVGSLRTADIKLIGPVPNTELNRYYSSSHVFVLPSIEEGFGMVMAEALSCGCPVIASANTGAQDLFTHGKEGFIVPIRDSASIVDCLTRLADEPDLRNRMGAAAIERVAKLGGWSSYGDKYIDLCGRLAPARVRSN